MVREALPFALWLAGGAVLLFHQALLPAVSSPLLALARGGSSAVCVALVVSPLFAAPSCARFRTSTMRVLLLVASVLSTAILLFIEISSQNLPMGALEWVLRLVAFVTWSALGPLWALAGTKREMEHRRLTTIQGLGLCAFLLLSSFAKLHAPAGSTWSHGARLAYLTLGLFSCFAWWGFGFLVCRRISRKDEAASRKTPDTGTAASASTLSALEGSSLLTKRETDVLVALLDGAKQVEVARHLGLSPSTVGTYRARALQKLKLRSLDELSPKMEQRSKQRTSSCKTRFGRYTPHSLWSPSYLP